MTLPLILWLVGFLSMVSSFALNSVYLHKNPTVIWGMGKWDGRLLMVSVWLICLAAILTLLFHGYAQTH